MSGGAAFPSGASEGRALPLPVEVCRDELLRLLGYPEGRAPGRLIAGLLDEQLAEGRGLLRPRGVYRRVPASRAAEVGLPSEQAVTLVLGLVTVGGEVEERVARLLAAGESVRALALDAVASAAVEEAADHLCARVLADGGGRDATDRVSCRISPGYRDWALTAQPRVFALLPHESLGVRLLPSLMMVPRKSVSFAMWLGGDGAPVPGLSGCDHCTLERCTFRRGRPS